MEPHSEPPVPAVITAMARLDRAVAAHKILAQRLVTAAQEAEGRDDILRRTDLRDPNALEEAARRYADAVGLVQTLSIREERARVELQQAQGALALVRQRSSRDRAETLRIELEIDAASIWDLVGRFEQQLRERLDAHGSLASEIDFFLEAGGERAHASTPWTPALGATGEALWNGIARGTAALGQRLAAPGAGERALPSAKPAADERALLPPTPQAAVQDNPPAAPAEETTRERMTRILRAVHLSRR